jgi:hypothetical protein
MFQENILRNPLQPLTKFPKVIRKDFPETFPETFPEICLETFPENSRLVF